MTASRTALLALRRAFAGCTDSARKQMALRNLRDAAALGDRNPERVAELMEMARHHLPYAQEITRRARA